MRCNFIPPYLLEQIARSDVDAEISRCGHSTLAIDEGLRTRRTAAESTVAGAVATNAVRDSRHDAWTVYTAANRSDLPGSPVRSSGEPASGDDAVDEAYVGVEASVALFREVFGRESYDGRGSPVIATVHFEKSYDNAFWDGRQLVFGDGDQLVFGRFTKPVDVLAHEFTHAVTQYTAALTYSGQSGALNESISDVFASCVKQRLLGQSAADADWLIGEGIFMPSVQGRALRSMASPGTAYDDPMLGRDPQVGSMSAYVETTDDNGGVHINSGIPNRAFSLTATSMGGSSWEGAGPIWYSALTSGIGADTDFAGFAAATLTAARAVSPEALGAVTSAWTQVGVTVPLDVPADAAGVAAGGSGRGSSSGSAGGASSGGGAGSDPGPSADRMVAVCRSGGFAGIRYESEVRLGDDPRTPEIEQLLDRIDARAFGVTQPQPDRYVYRFRLNGTEVTVGEHELTPELARLAALVLDD